MPHSYNAKNMDFVDAYGNLAGAVETNTNGDYSDDWVLSGTINLAEGIYYSDYQFAWATSYNTPQQYYSCPHANYRGFYDNDVSNLSRFQYRQRLKIIVDDEDQDPPRVI